MMMLVLIVATSCTSVVLESEIHFCSTIKRLYDHLEIEERVEATVIQTVGSKGDDGFAVLRVL